MRTVSVPAAISKQVLSGWLPEALSVLAGSAVLAVSAQIAVPMAPVPVTMQSLAVLGLGVVLGSRLGAAAVLAYLAEGASGLPVFAGLSGGVAHLAGPTAGYLVSFVPAAWLSGRLSQTGWGQTAGGSFMVYILGHALILGAGAAYLSAWAGVEQAVALGVTPFLAGSVVKSLLGAVAGLAVRRLINPA
jgi:biotin transport system substrate-specific component